MDIEPAVLADGPAVIDVLRTSITELCLADHGGRETALVPWLSNKTTRQFNTWLDNPNLIMRVARRHSTVVGFAMATADGQILLNYVSPSHRFSGVSKALLTCLEAELLRVGIDAASLSSTATALDFYRANGWTEDGMPVTDDDVISYPMRKILGSTRP